MKICTLNHARAHNLKRYFTGKPCLRGHVSERITSNKACLTCVCEESKRRRNYHDDWICKNRERHLHTKKIQRRKTLAKGRAWKAKHRAKRLNAVPSWADLFAIQTIYEKAHQKTKETGIKYVVDHIIPLQGEEVSGLHVVENLQIITDRENRAKGNKLLY